mmetsp:Transcript_984/g.1319  ORF Transcript_984/g.1319 Transcript_984/m.1319 type:complete len:199 (+) Transcript_984:114-710(+)
MSETGFITQNDDVQFLKTGKTRLVDDTINLEVNVKKNRYPYSIVWGSLPCLTWLVPLIGHLGITDSEGRIHDFAGPYTICIDDFMTGSVIKYWQIDPRSIDFESLKTGEAKSHKEAWDLALKKGDAFYRTQIHNLCCNNCHSHVRYCVNMMGINQGTWTVWGKFQLNCKFVSFSRALMVYLPFIVIVGLIILFSNLKV